MLAAGGNGGENINSRPFVLGLILLLIFFSLQTQEWSNRRPGTVRGGTTRETPAQHRETVKEKVILELSLSHEKLEAENQRLKVDVITLKRRLRECHSGAEPLVPRNSTEDDGFLSEAGHEEEEPGEEAAQISPAVST